MDARRNQRLNAKAARPTLVAVSALAGAVLGFLGAALLFHWPNVPSEPARPIAAQPSIRFSPVSYDDLPGWGAEAIHRGAAAFRASCARLRYAEPDRLMADRVADAHPSRRFYGLWSDWEPICRKATELGADISPSDWRGLFAPFRVHGPEAETGLLTGYYEPELLGSLGRNPAYPWPLRARPRKMVTVNLSEFGIQATRSTVRGVLEANGRLAPYPARAALRDLQDDKAGEPIVWLADPADAFFVEIQGSARIRLEGGGVVRVTYDADNGHAYRSIGRVLIDRGALAPHDADLSAIRAWMRRAGDVESRRLMDENPRKVFFQVIRLREPEQGPAGALGAPLTPGGSVAVDRAHHALGAAAWIAATSEQGEPRRGLVAFQDVGDAIRGPVRADYFTGWGDAAEAQAGRMRDALELWVFRPRAMGAWAPEE